jgi:hypothetical protein
MRSTLAMFYRRHSKVDSENIVTINLCIACYKVGYCNEG